jgi:hypothetical protein
MTFGLKNAGATYQRAMNYIFHELIGKVVEIYIDDVMAQPAAHQEGAQAQGGAAPGASGAQAAYRLPPSDSYSSLGFSYL